MTRIQFPPHTDWPCSPPSVQSNGYQGPCAWG